MTLRQGRGRLLALAAVACAVPAGLAQADGGAHAKENIAVATTETDGGRAFDLAWSTRRQHGGVVDHRNVANAAARCTDCRATSIAFQIVLVVGTPERLEPHNQALAINDQCTRCVVYAGARQFVRVVDQPVRYTGEGRRTLADVRRALRGLEGQELTAEQLRTEVEAQEARVNAVLRDELVPLDADDDDERERPRDRRDREDDDD